MSSKYKQKTVRQCCLLSAGEAFVAFVMTRGGEDCFHLLSLWDSWEVVLGADLSSLGAPLGHKGTTLLVGVPDSMAMQELSMQKTEVLERVNAFMDKPMFDKVHLVLLQKQIPLNGIRVSRSQPKPPTIRLEAPPGLGGLLGKLNPDSPVTKCYEAYVRLFAEDHSNS